MEADRLTITHSADGGLVLQGDLDSYSAPLLDAELASHDAERLSIDMSRVAFMDSSGLRVLVAADNSVRERGGQMVILAPSVPVRRLFELTAIDQHLSIRDELPEGDDDRFIDVRVQGDQVS